ncbi:IS3 family transposase [Thomasclavelia cocleata]
MHLIGDLRALINWRQNCLTYVNWCNNIRVHVVLNYMSLVEYRMFS